MRNTSSASNNYEGLKNESELARLVVGSNGDGEVAVGLSGGAAGVAVWTFFSREEKEAREQGVKRRHTGLHTPSDCPGAVQALEISVLALCGRAPSQPRRYAFALGGVVCLVACGLAGYLYPRDPEFTLTAVQKGLGFVGVFLVLASACALACVWFPGWFARCTTERCALAEAPALLIFCEDGSQHNVRVLTRPGPNPDAGPMRCADFRHARFCYDPTADAFLLEEPVDPLADAAAHGLAFTQGLEPGAVGQRAAWHGSNLIDVPMPKIWQQLTDEVLNPFVFFQLFSCTQWLLQKYWKYSLIVFLITLMAACISLVISRQNFARLRDLSRHEALVAVRRGLGSPERVMSTQLVPGDIFCVEENMDLPCDAVLVAGECLVSEAMLTGESVPVAKTAAPPSGAPTPAKALLSGGTRVLQTRSPQGGAVLARVARIGFATEKGRLIRSILFPRAGRMDLTRDGNRFVGYVLVPMALAGGVASCVHALQQGKSFTVASALDMVSIAVPPALPATMMVGVATAVNRLRKRAIFCIAPNRVNMAGRITRVCFDKTGTLTYDGLTMQGLRPLVSTADEAASEAPDASSAGGARAIFADEVPASAVLDTCNVGGAATLVEGLALVMAGCQSLRHLTSATGELSLVGDPLEVVMLQSSGWSLHTSGADGTVNVRSPSGSVCAAQTQVFDFNSEYARMAACVTLTDPRTGSHLADAHRVLVKGSPEAVMRLCHPATVPTDFDAVLAHYAGLGYRVLGTAERVLSPTEAVAASAGDLTREQAEGRDQLRFCGLVVLENQLKPSSAGVIAALQAADIQCVMVTGDHARTAVTVARAANIIGRNVTCVLVDAASAPEGGRTAAFTILAHAPGSVERTVDAATALGPECHACRFVATGAGYDALTAAAEGGAPDALNTVLPRLCVAARFQPHQKQGVVGLFIERGDFTAFVGDGANDSAALKAADVGLSLTADAEASVAAPFTSKNADIASAITLLLEGRAALATSFQVFKFMALYAAVQFSCSLQMNLANSYLSENEFLWVDLLVVLPLSGLLPQTRAYHQLSSRRPCASLLHWSVVASVSGQMGINLAFQLAVRALTRAQCWFQPQDFQCCDSAYVPANTTQSVCPLLPPPGPCIACTEAFSAIVPSYENTTLWLLANAQYLWLAAALAISRPFRQPQYTNVPFSLCWLVLLTCTVALIFNGSRFVLGTFDLIALPDANFRWAIMTLSLLSGLCSFSLEAMIEETMIAHAEHKEPLKRMILALRRALQGSPDT